MISLIKALLQAWLEQWEPGHRGTFFCCDVYLFIFLMSAFISWTFHQCFVLKDESVRSEQANSRSATEALWTASTWVLCFASHAPGKMIVSSPSISLVQKMEVGVAISCSLAPQSVRWWVQVSLSLPSGGDSLRSELSFCLLVGVWGVSGVFLFSRSIFYCSTFFLNRVLMFDSKCSKN